MDKLIKKPGGLKTAVVGLVMFLYTAVSSYAQDLIPPQLQNLADQIAAVFTGPFVRTIIVIALAASGVGFAVNKDNEKMKKHFGAVVIATAIIAVAQFIIDKLYQSAS